MPPQLQQLACVRVGVAGELGMHVLSLWQGCSGGQRVPLARWRFAFFDFTSWATFDKSDRPVNPVDEFRRCLFSPPAHLL